MTDSTTQTIDAQVADARIGHINYALFALAPFTLLLLAIVGVIIAHVKRDDYRGTYLESHLAWQIRTFWWGLLWSVLAGLVMFVLAITIVGLLILWLPGVIVLIWWAYRVIKGWLRLLDGKPVD